MNEQAARNVVLVQAIETADTAHEILSDDDRLYATRSARELAQWAAAEQKSPVTTELFLAQRAEQIIKRLSERWPRFAAFIRRRPLWPAFSAVLPLLGLLAGAGLDRIAAPHRVDLLSAPLLLILVWNLSVYLALLFWAMMPKRRRRLAGTRLLRRFTVGNSALPRRLPGVFTGALARFMDDWSALSAPLTHARLARAVHLAAACFAFGAVTSLYARGLLMQYVAGWESTFLNAQQVHALLSLLFAPALAIFPLHGFSLADIEALRFGAQPSPQGGAQWVHLYAATLLLGVSLPRLILASFAGWRARSLRRRFPLDVNGAYFANLAQAVGTGVNVVLRIIPYSFTVDAARDEGLTRLAKATLGEQARTQLWPSSPYGEEPRVALAQSALDDPSVTATTVLFTATATPEPENHGAFLDYLVQHCPRGVSVLVDESGLAQRWAEQAGGAARLAERAALWRQFCSFHGTQAHIVNLLDPAGQAITLAHAAPEAP